MQEVLRCQLSDLKLSISWKNIQSHILEIKKTEIYFQPLSVVLACHITSRIVDIAFEPIALLWNFGETSAQPPKK